MLIIQHIHTTWTKASPGMPEAATRNRVPRVLPLPLPVRNPDDCYLHYVDCAESSHFVPSAKTDILNQAKQYWSLSIERQNNSFVISFTYDPRRHGQPSRHTGHHRIRLFTLASGESGSFHINGRFAYEATWYEQHFINLANVIKADAQLFIQKSPDYFVDKTALLF